jgi:acyl-CoA hydrolase
VAAVVARRHAGRDCVTLGIDSVRFLAPARRGDLLVFQGAVNRVWRTSLEVGVKVWTEETFTRRRTHIVSAYFTFVAVDGNLQPVPIPPVIPNTDEEKRRYEEAEERRAARLKSTK